MQFRNIELELNYNKLHFGGSCSNNDSCNSFRLNLNDALRTLQSFGGALISDHFSVNDCVVLFKTDNFQSNENITEY